MDNTTPKKKLLIQQLKKEIRTLKKEKRQLEKRIERYEFFHRILSDLIRLNTEVSMAKIKYQRIKSAKLKKTELGELRFEPMDAEIIAQKKEEAKQMLQDITPVLKVLKEWIQRSEKEVICKL